MKSIASRITEDIATVLDSIRVNSGATFNADATENSMQGVSFLPDDLTLIVGPLAPVNNGALGRDHYMQTYYIICTAGVSDVSIANTDQRRAQDQAADVVKALQDDYQRSGLALNTYFRMAKNGEQLPESAGQIVIMDVQFWTLRDDPFTQ